MTLLVKAVRCSEVLISFGSRCRGIGSVHLTEGTPEIAQDRTEQVAVAEFFWLDKSGETWEWSFLGEKWASIWENSLSVEQLAFWPCSKSTFLETEVRDRT